MLQDWQCNPILLIVGRFEQLPLILFVLVAAFPVRLWFDFGPLHTLTILDIALWLLVFAILPFVRGFKIGPPILFAWLAVPTLMALISLCWAQDSLSAIKATLYSLTGVLAYLASLNLYYRRSPRFIAACMGLFVIAAVLTAFLYWLRIPLAWRIMGLSLENLPPADSYSYAAAFARLDSPYLGRSNDFATTLALFVPFFLGVMRAARKMRYAIVAFVAALGCLLAMSRGVLFALVLVLTLPFLFRLSLRKLAVSILVAALLIVPLFIFVTRVSQTGIDMMDRTLSNLKNVQERFDRFNVAADVISRAPFLGYGAGRYIPKDVDAMDSAFHNTYLEQWAAYGLIFGSVANLALIILPLCFFQWSANNYAVKTVAGYVGLSVITYLLICTNQTSNESAIPSLMFRLFLGFAVAYLLALQREGRQSLTQQES